MNRSDHFTSIAFSAIAAWISFIGNADAQGFSNASTVHINGANIYVTGGVKNSGLINNDGLIAFTEDWNNVGGYSGKGTVQPNGDAPQKIAHNDQQIYRLLITGSGTKYIMGGISITGELDLNQGLVILSPDDVLKLTRDAVVKGGSSESFIDGALTTEGNGYKFFPVGKGGRYAPIEFLEVFGATGEYSMEVFENAPAVAIDGVIVDGALYWQRKVISGEFKSSVIALAYEPSNFTDPQAVVLVGGSEWHERFDAIKNVSRSEEVNSLITRVQVSSPIIMLGELTPELLSITADFYLSTALSPNASQPENRKVMIFGNRLADQGFHFQVFNRWGDVVYETDSLTDMASNGWDGRSIQGPGLRTGTYPYRLTAIDKTGRPFERKGVITIIH